MMLSPHKRIPYFVDPPDFSPEMEKEITRITFGDPQEPKPCDIIFIFGGSYPGLWDTAARAFHSGLGKDIVATGGRKSDALRHKTWNYGDMAEAEVIQQQLVLLGVPAQRIFIETESENTYENVLNAITKYDFSKILSVLAVCKSYAVGRQIRTLRAQLSPEVKIVPLPFDAHLAGTGPIISRDNWTEYQDARRYIFANLLKIYQYGSQGHLKPVSRYSRELETVIKISLEQMQ